MPEWTDVLIDFRVHDRRPLPVLPSGIMAKPIEPGEIIAWAHRWPVRADGWALDGFAWVPGRTTSAGVEGLDAVSVARFTDPTGFRFAIAVSQDRPGERAVFQAGRFSFLMPVMRWVFLSITNNHQRPRTVGRGRKPVPPRPAEQDPWVVPPRPAATFTLDFLGEAIRDPGRWFARPRVDALSTPVPGPFRPTSAARVLLAWAGAGAGSFEEIRDWAEAGLDPAEVTGWQQLNNPASDGTEVPEDKRWADAEIRDWFTHLGGGTKRRQQALRYRNEGLSPEQAARWAPVISGHALGRGTSTKQVVDRFEAVGWTGADVEAVHQALAAERYRHDPYPYAVTDLSDIIEWTFIASGRAVRYMRAGVDLPEARHLEATDEAPDDMALDMLGALRPEPVPVPLY